MRCVGCDNMIPDGVKFCPICGTKQPAAAAPPPPPPAQYPQYPQYPQNQQYGQYNQYQQNYGAPPAKESPCYVGFGEAIKLYFKNYVNFKGRSTRSEYWFSYLFVFLISIACNILNMIFPVFTLLASMVFLLPTLAIQFRRFHDTGRKGTIVLISHIITSVFSTFGAIMLIILLLGAFGVMPDYSDTKALFTFIGICLMSIFPLVLNIYCIVIFCQPSVPEANKYGRAPY